MASIAYQKKEVFHIQFEIGDSLGAVIDLAVNMAGMDHDDFNCFKIMAFEALPGGRVEMTLVYLSQDQEV